MALNPFGGSEITARPQAGALVEVEQQRAIAETQAAMIIAKRFPRDQKEAVDRILMACTRPTLAESALYEYARGGTPITGPSIRLAEAIAQNWGNMQFGIRELEQRKGSSTVEAFAWDVETNTRQVKTFQVAHRRHTRNGSYDLTDPRDIYEMTANQGARRLRACILGVVPGDVVDAAVKQCEQTMQSKVKVTPELIKSLLEKYSQYGVTKAMIEKRIQRNIDTITPALVTDLGKKFNSIRDGMSSPADWFDMHAVDGEQPTAEAVAAAMGGEAQPAAGTVDHEALQQADPGGYDPKTYRPPYTATNGPRTREEIEQADFEKWVSEKPTFLVVIKKCGDQGWWYSNKIGKEFSVFDHDKLGKYGMMVGKECYLIEYEDAEKVDEWQPPPSLLEWPAIAALVESAGLEKLKLTLENLGFGGRVKFLEAQKIAIAEEFYRLSLEVPDEQAS